MGALRFITQAHRFRLDEVFCMTYTMNEGNTGERTGTDRMVFVRVNSNCTVLRGRKSDCKFTCTSKSRSHRYTRKSPTWRSCTPGAERPPRRASWPMEPTRLQATRYAYAQGATSPPPADKNRIEKKTGFRSNGRYSQHLHNVTRQRTVYREVLGKLGWYRILYCIFFVLFPPKQYVRLLALNRAIPLATHTAFFSRLLRLTSSLALVLQLRTNPTKHA
jgi:hypothetical protein